MNLNKLFKILFVGNLLLIFSSCGGDNEIDTPIIDIPIIEVPEEDIPVEVVMVFRTEYEKVGEVLLNIEDTNEGAFNYSISAGNDQNYYMVDGSSGVISIKNQIQDSYNEIHADTILVTGGSKNYKVTIVDGFDYYLNKFKDDYTVLSEHKETFIDENSEWTAYNNLWGKGSAIPNKDFRIVTMYKNSFPNGTILMWDVPSAPSEFGGPSVWCYNDVFFGNRKGAREDLLNFPFQMKQLNSLVMEFDFEQLFGNEQYKIAMNMFMTNESYLTNFSANKGDFFFVFDQKETWIPNYPISLSDTMIEGRPFAWRYKKEGEYEWRRVIIKDEQKYLKGSLDIKSLFDRFIDNGYINPEQYIYHIQVGIEVTQGYGAVRFNEIEMNMELN